MTITTVMSSVLLTITTVMELDDDYCYDDYLYRHDAGGHDVSTRKRRSLSFSVMLCTSKALALHSPLQLLRPCRDCGRLPFGIACNLPVGIAKNGVWNLVASSERVNIALGRLEFVVLWVEPAHSR